MSRKALPYSDLWLGVSAGWPLAFGELDAGNVKPHVATSLAC